MASVFIRFRRNASIELQIFCCPFVVLSMGFLLVFVWQPYETASWRNSGGKTASTLQGRKHSASRREHSSRPKQQVPSYRSVDQAPPQIPPWHSLCIASSIGVKLLNVTSNIIQWQVTYCYVHKCWYMNQHCVILLVTLSAVEIFVFTHDFGKQKLQLRLYFKIPPAQVDWVIITTSASRVFV